MEVSFGTCYHCHYLLRQENMAMVHFFLLQVEGSRHKTWRLLVGGKLNSNRSIWQLKITCCSLLYPLLSSTAFSPTQRLQSTRLLWLWKEREVSSSCFLCLLLLQGTLLTHRHSSSHFLTCDIRLWFVYDWGWFPWQQGLTRACVLPHLQWQNAAVGPWEESLGFTEAGRGIPQTWHQFFFSLSWDCYDT